MSSNRPDHLFWATRWTVIDVVTLVATAIVLGVIFYLWDWAFQLLNRLVGDIISGLFRGIWYWAGLWLAFAIRKPGAALLGQFGAALVQFGLGAPSGVLVLVLGFVQGLALEVVFAWAHFNHWGLVGMAVAGAMAGLADFGVNLIAPPLLLALRSGGAIFATFCLIVLSGAVVGGVLCKLLADRLLAIPVVRNFLGTQVSAGE
jgi:energy-coupling factor transport system substrate-specific component